MRILSCVSALFVVVSLTETIAFAQQPPSNPARQSEQAPQLAPSPQTTTEPLPQISAQSAPVQQQQAQQPAGQLTQTPRTPGPSATGETVVHYELGPMVLAVIVLLVLGYLFWVMIHYANRLAQTGPLGFQVKDALGTIRQQTIIKTLSEKWDAGKYFQEVMNDSNWLSSHPVPNVPDDLKDDFTVRSARSYLFEAGRLGVGGAPGFSPWVDETPDKAQKKNNYIQDLRTWETETLAPEARRRYEKELQSQFASGGPKAVIEYFDFASVWGQGPEFVLQFTAVVTIIFAVVALGILQRLGEDQAGTILAAIAGYVLGQATSRSRTTRSEHFEQALTKTPEPPVSKPEQMPSSKIA